MTVSKLRIAFAIVTAYLLSTVAFIIVLSISLFLQSIIPFVVILATALKWILLFAPFIVKVGVIIIILDKITKNDINFAYAAKIYFIGGIIIHTFLLLFSIFPEFDSYALTMQILYVITSIFPLYSVYQK